MGDAFFGVGEKFGANLDLLFGENLDFYKKVVQ